MNLGEPANGVLRHPLQKLDGEGWWRSFRDSGTSDAEGFAVFEEDPTIPETAAAQRNSVPCERASTCQLESALVTSRAGSSVRNPEVDRCKSFGLTSPMPSFDLRQDLHLDPPVRDE